MLTVLSDSFMLATRMDAFSYVERPGLETRRAKARQPRRSAPLATLRRALRKML